MGVGDEVVAAGQAQRLFDADPSTRVAICDVDWIPRWHDIWEHNPIIARPSDVARGEQVRTVTNGPGCRPYIVYPFDEETGWTFNTSFRARDHVAKIYLTPAEQQRGTVARDIYGPYVLIEPFTKHLNFKWPLKCWTQLVAACPDLTFIQHVHKDSMLVAGAYAEPANFREACGLVSAAEVYVRSESGMCHAAAALGVPQVTLFGACMDPEVMGYYPNQTVLADRGPDSPCGCWRPCEHCQKTMALLSVDEVIVALRERMRVREAA